jgi:hypothetical protein
MAKKFGVSMAQIEKLHQFQISLVAKKIKSVATYSSSKMRFIGLVQIAFEKPLDAEVRKLFVSSCQDVPTY